METPDNPKRAAFSRRSFVKGGLAATGALTVGAGLLEQAAGASAQTGGLTAGDIAMLRFLAAGEALEADFAEFLRFVRTIERGRKERAEVAGLPVFLVLTKCDLLARPGDSPADWMERIEQRKREVGDRFKSFLAEEKAARDDQLAPVMA